MLSHADEALYQAKSKRRGSYRFFTGAMDAEVRERVRTISELREDITSQQFFLEYEPQVAVDSGHIFIAVSLISALCPVLHHCVVALQADSLGDASQSGWTVTVVGSAGEVHDPALTARLRGMGLSSWAAAETDRFMHISRGIVTGQRLSATS